MDLKTYRAKSLQEALQLVRRDLGPDAAVLHTREIGTGPFRWLSSKRGFEVTATNEVHVPSRFHSVPEPPATPHPLNDPSQLDNDPTEPPPPIDAHDYREQYRQDLQEQVLGLESLVEEMCEAEQPATERDSSHSDQLFRLFSDLLAAEVTEDAARGLVDQLRTTATAEERRDGMLLRARLLRQIESEIHCAGPIRITPGQRKMVALVGPTGVGKTTTIAKLAANFHLRERHRVGLITVDTYRIAAVDQLRTYADIIDLPMEVVSTPREMRAAVARLSHLDLILMDTAGRSPRDEVRIRELKSLLGEAQPDEVQLVLSCVASPQSLSLATERFTDVGVTSLLITKLDEATGLGGLIPLLRQNRLPLSYLTHGQNVPEDIRPAERRSMARALLGFEEHTLSFAPTR